MRDSFMYNGHTMVSGRIVQEDTRDANTSRGFLEFVFYGLWLKFHI